MTNNYVLHTKKIQHANLMQKSGSLTQSVLQRNLSQASHPMGGVLAKPLSRAREDATDIKRNTLNIV